MKAFLFISIIVSLIYISGVVYNGKAFWVFSAWKPVDDPRPFVIQQNATTHPYPDFQKAIVGLRLSTPEPDIAENYPVHMQAKGVIINSSHPISLVWVYIDNAYILGTGFDPLTGAPQNSTLELLPSSTVRNGDYYTTTLGYNQSDLQFNGTSTSGFYGYLVVFYADGTPSQTFKSVWTVEVQTQESVFLAHMEYNIFGLAIVGFYWGYLYKIRRTFRKPKPQRRQPTKTEKDLVSSVKELIVVDKGIRRELSTLNERLSADHQNITRKLPTEIEITPETEANREKEKGEEENPKLISDSTANANK